MTVIQTTTDDHITSKTALDLETQGMAQLQASLVQLQALLKQEKSEFNRGALRGRIYGLQRRLASFFPWHSQSGQDRFIDEAIFKGATGGVFVDVGAYDGVNGSNTLFFEQFRGWRGILVEPSPKWCEVARSFRKMPCLQVAVGNEEGMAEFLRVDAGYTQMGGLVDSYDTGLKEQVTSDPRFEGKVVQVQVRRLDNVLKEHGLTRVDYLSLDVEGAEADILEDFPFQEYDIKVFSIENNLNTDNVAKIMRAADYSLLQMIGVDEIWCQTKLVKK